MTELRSPFIPPRRTPSLGRGLFGWVLFILLAVMLFAMFQNKNRSMPMISLSQFDLLLRSSSIKSMVVGSDEVTGELTSATALPNGQNITTFRAVLPAGSNGSGNFIQYILENRGKADVSVDNNQNLLISVLVPVVPWILIFAFIWFFVFRRIRAAAHGQI
jgi:ATP-dependent Zn protease